MPTPFIVFLLPSDIHDPFYLLGLQRSSRVNLALSFPLDTPFPLPLPLTPPIATASGYPGRGSGCGRAAGARSASYYPSEQKHA